MAVKEVEAVFRDGLVVVASQEDSEALLRGGYGTSLEGEGGFTLSPYEALYLLADGRVGVVDGETGEPMDFQTLLGRLSAKDGEVWVKYLVYRDLRSRGYVVREGFGEGITFRVYGRGDYGEKAAKYVVFVVCEGSPVLVDRVREVMRLVRGMKKELIVAVMDRRGEIVYYTLSQLSLR